MNNLFKTTLIAVSLVTVSAQASLTATDNAADSAYTGGGNFNGLNGGSGFSGWSGSSSAPARYASRNAR